MVEAIYSRQSKDKKDSISIEAQIEFCKRECLHPEHALIYEDKGFSGKNLQRPAFQQLLEDLRAGKINKVIVYRLDRLSRSIVDFSQLWQELDKNNADFVSVNEKFDTTTPMGRAMIYIIMVFAQLERETIAERVTDNYYSRIKKGYWPGGPAPYGMKNIRIINDEGQSVPSLDYTETFDVVQETFYKYSLEDVSLGDIAKDLTERGIPCKKRKSWDNVAVSRLLHSPVYVKADEKVYRYFQSRGVKNFSNSIEEFDGTSSVHIVGKRTGNERKYTNLEEHVVSLTNFPGRIPSDIWLACQYKLNTNKQIGNSGKGKHTWLTGLMKCGKCGYSISVRRWNEKRYLCCSGRNNLHICEQKSFTQQVADVESAVEKELKAILEECNQTHIQIPERDNLMEVHKELEEVEAQIQKLVALMLEANSVSMKYINAELEKLETRKIELLQACQTPVDDKKQYFKGIVFDELEFEEKKMVAQAFIKQINVFDDSIEIIWKI